MSKVGINNANNLQTVQSIGILRIVLPKILLESRTVRESCIGEFTELIQFSRKSANSALKVR